MNFYALLPFFAFFANMLLGFYILYRNPKAMLNRLYALSAFLLAVWSVGDYYTFTSQSPESALFWSKFATVGSSVSITVMLHFFLVFTRKEFIRNKINIFLLYLPAMFFEIVNVSTNLISRSGEVAYWGYAAVRSYLYPPMTFYMVGYISIGLVYCYKFYKMIPSTKEKTQAKLLIFAFLIPLIGGSLTQVVFPLIGLKVVPLSTTLTTITSGIIAFAMVRYGLMSITPGMAAENIIETMTDYVIVIKTDNTISLVNMSFLDALGYERNELKNKPVGSLLTRKGEFKTRVTDRLEKEGRVTNYETDLRTKKGKHISVSLNGSVIRNKFKKIIGFVLVMRDIREAKSMIRELTKNANELEKSKHELEIKVGELEKFSKLTVGKELKMINFKKKILELEEQLNRHGIEHMGEE